MSRGVASSVAGVDEAGRGPVLGPLVVAGVLVDEAEVLAEAGVKDSKALNREKREILFETITGHARKVEVRVVPPDELDRRMGRENLNAVEVSLFAEVLETLGASHAFVDACDVNAARFGDRVRARLTRPCSLVSEHKADERYPVVSAASIVAKVLRDRAIDELRREVGCEVGSGYSHDPVTRAFLKRWVDDTGDLPPGVRRRWETAQRLIRHDRSLLEFTGG